MSTIVGQFPAPAILTRMPINPMDRCTIVSVFPKEIEETKATLSPSRFYIPACTNGKFEILVVGPSSWWRELDESQPFLEIQVNSIQMASSIINDYCQGLIGCNMGDKKPGLFFVPGAFDKVSILKYNDGKNSFEQLLEQARERQKNWFMELVKISDAMWARTNGNPLAIYNDARLAASYLNLEKPWMQDFKVIDMKNCPSCGSLVNPIYPICANCKAIINSAKAKELDLKFSA